MTNRGANTNPNTIQKNGDPSYALPSVFLKQDKLRLTIKSWSPRKDGDRTSLIVIYWLLLYNQTLVILLKVNKFPSEARLMFHEYMRRFNYGILNLKKYKRVPDFTPFP